MNNASTRLPDIRPASWFLVCLLGLSVLFGSFATARSADLDEIRERRLPGIEQALKEKGLAFGAPVFIRIFKTESRLELWLKDGDRFKLYKDYGICYFSGELGPKLKEGDRQSLEGFYFVTKGSLNPRSTFHLSFNLGFPNAYDRANKRTGSLLMVHGNCVSIGCYAMTDPVIEEVYLLVEAALNNGQRFFRVHAFPFRMTEENMTAHQKSKWAGYWADLKIGYDFFEKVGRPPNVTVSGRKYVVEDLPPADGSAKD